MAKSIPYQILLQPDLRDRLKIASERLNVSSAAIIKMALSDWFRANQPQLLESAADDAPGDTIISYKRVRGRPRGHVPRDSHADLYASFAKGSDRVTIDELVAKIEQSTGKPAQQYANKAFERALTAHGWHNAIEVRKDGSETVVWVAQNPWVLHEG